MVPQSWLCDSMIYVGSILGGPEVANAPIADVIEKVSRGARGGAEGDFGSLDLVFHVAGSLVQPEFEGVRTGLFSRKERLLQVQIAVPAEVVASADSYAFLVDRVEEAIRVAGPRFRKASIPYPQDEYLARVERLRQMGVH